MAPPDARLRHVLNRFSYGLTPELVAQARQAGGADAWFARQLRVPAAMPLYRRSWWPTNDWTPARRSAAPSGYDLGVDLDRWTIQQRQISPWQVYELMVQFWSDHLNMPSFHPRAYPWRAQFDGLIRRHALGRVDRLIPAASEHPAMLCYLDQALSSSRAVNENHAREILELHTVGGGYDETDVHDAARLMTGWKIDLATCRVTYDASRHVRGPVRIMDFRSPNASGDGRPAMRAFYTYLARHPLTAAHLARKLCVRFVSDTPSQAIVDAVAAAYLRHDTAVVPMLRTLVTHPDFARSAGQKTRTPADDVLATLRALGVRMTEPRTPRAAGTVLVGQMEVMGQRPFGWLTPDGAPDEAIEWASVGRMLQSWRLHFLLASGNYPNEGVVYRQAADWLPRLPARYADVVAHIGRRVLQAPIPPDLVAACCDISGLTPRTRLDRSMQTLEWRVVQILQTTLNHPAFLRR